MILEGGRFPWPRAEDLDFSPLEQVVGLLPSGGLVYRRARPVVLRRGPETERLIAGFLDR